MRTCVILNTHAGSAAAYAQTIHELKGRYGCDILRTEAAGDATRFAQTAREKGVDRIVAAGGDGTMNEVLNGIAPDFDAVELGVIPLGTGNDLVRSLGLWDVDLETAIECAVQGATYPLDIGVAMTTTSTDDDVTRYFLNAISAGVGPRVIQRIDPDTKRRFGRFAYWAASVAELSNPPVYDITAVGDGTVGHVRAHGLAVANGRFIGGGIAIAPRARLDDGSFELVVLPEHTFLENVSIGVEMLLQLHADDQRILTVRAKEIAIHAEPRMPMHMDGERLGEVDARFQILPGALRVAATDQAPGLQHRPSATYAPD